MVVVGCRKSPPGGSGLGGDPVRCRVRGRRADIASARTGHAPVGQHAVGLHIPHPVTGRPSESVWSTDLKKHIVRGSRRDGVRAEVVAPGPGPRRRSPGFALRSIILRTTVRTKTESSPCATPVPSLPQCPE
ncbi:hypothetical protein GCM10009839_53430 [Catenulispora yoronensis]|uniref:Transposase n=1 Tax=Catenulispora yoronensis TaxID=450799 RepID=A0ABN2UU12_9ACTN